MYENKNRLDDFYKFKPELNHKQRLLFNAFARIGQEREVSKGIPYPIKESSIRLWIENNGSCSYAPDLFIMAIQLIDTEYISKKYAEIERKNKG